MRHINDEGLELIKSFESLRLKPYLDAVGIPTIGWGSTQGVTMTMPPITIEEAQRLLRRDLESAERSVLRLISVPLSDGQFAALVSFAFNCGGGALQRSTLRMKINQEEWEEVPAEFLKWSKAGGRTLKGLVRRRQAEAALFSRATAPAAKTAPWALELTAAMKIGAAMAPKL